MGAKADRVDLQQPIHPTFGMVDMSTDSDKVTEQLWYLAKTHMTKEGKTKIKTVLGGLKDQKLDMFLKFATHYPISAIQIFKTSTHQLEDEEVGMIKGDRGTVDLWWFVLWWSLGLLFCFLWELR